MKRLIYILILFLTCSTSMAQKVLLKNLTTFDDKRLHFGFSLGVNTTDFGIMHYNVIGDNPNFDPNNIEVVGGVAITADKRVRADIVKMNPGFTVGIVTNLRLSDSFDLRFLPGMSFGSRSLTYNIPVDDVNSAVSTGNMYSIKSTFLDFPLLVKYKARRMNNQRPYIVGGVSSKIDISKTGKEDLVRLKSRNPSIEAGMGWDMYMQFFRLSTEFKFCFGLRNILDNGPKEPMPQVYTNAFSRISSNMFILSFHFE